MIIVYIAVPTYGLIHDLVGPGEAVFVLHSPLPGVQMNRPGRGLFAKIHAFLFPPREVPVPLLQRIDLRGRVIYTDKTPYMDGLVEFRSTPRYTRTDDGGYFFFLDVEEGEHTISVLDEEGRVLATCRINIERIAVDPDMVVEQNLEVKGIELVRLPDGTYVFQVAMNIELLEITLFLERDAGGNMIGLDRIEVGLAGSETIAPRPPGQLPEPPGDPEEPGSPGEPSDSQVEPEKPLLPPVEPEKPSPPSGGSGGDETGGEGPGQLPPPFGFDVFDTATAVQYGRESAVKVNIFGAKKRLAPGMSGSYNFTVDNGENDFPSRYDLLFIAEDTLPEGYRLPLCYRLKADGVYVAGNETAWLTPRELYQDTVLGGRKKTKYTLEWYWPEGERDQDFARFGGNPAYSYSLTIKVTAQGQ